MSPNLTEFSDRLLALCDGRLGLRGGIHVEIREPSPAICIPGKDAWNEIPTRRDRVPDSSPSSPATCHSSHILDFISSDETLDRYDEIIAASGWRLANYQRNPVFQNAHQYGDLIFTLGKALATEVRSGRLFQRVEFACDINPMARIAYGLYKAKFLSA